MYYHVCITRLRVHACTRVPRVLHDYVPVEDEDDAVDQFEKLYTRDCTSRKLAHRGGLGKWEGQYARNMSSHVPVTKPRFMLCLFDDGVVGVRARKENMPILPWHPHRKVAHGSTTLQMAQWGSQMDGTFIIQLCHLRYA